MISGKFDFNIFKSRVEMMTFLNDNQPFAFLQIIEDTGATYRYTIYYATGKKDEKKGTI